MRKQTSPILLRLGINRGWNLNFLANFRFYSLSLKLCIFLFLLVRSQFIKKKLWLILQFMFFTFEKLFIKIFFWKFFTKSKKKIKFFFVLKKKINNILNENVFLNLKKLSISLTNVKRYLKFKSKNNSKDCSIFLKKNYSM